MEKYPDPAPPFPTADAEKKMDLKFTFQKKTAKYANQKGAFLYEFRPKKLFRRIEQDAQSRRMFS